MSRTSVKGGKGGESGLPWWSPAVSTSHDMPAMHDEPSEVPAREGAYARTVPEAATERPVSGI